MIEALNAPNQEVGDVIAVERETTMRRGTAVRLMALALALSTGAFACDGGDGLTDPVPQIAGSYTAQTTIGDVTLHIQQQGRQLSGEGSYRDGDIVTDVDIDGEIIDFSGGDRVIMALTAANFDPAFITLDFLSSTGTIGGVMQRGSPLLHPQIVLIPMAEAQLAKRQPREE